MLRSEPVLRVFLPEALPAGLTRLRGLLPDLVTTPLGFELTLRDHAPEEVLALFLCCGVTARATRIIERPPPG